jgi:L-lactate dehydrogenase (cytochrome)
MSEPTRALASGPVFQERLRSLPSVYHLRHAAMRRLPGFAFDVGDGGAGLDMGIRRNWQALDTVELLPRYGVTSALPLTTVSLFGEQYSAPIGIAPMGSPGIIWPGADRILAQAAQRAGVPFTLSTVSGMSIEEASQFAPDRLWVQMYRFANNDQAIGLDMVARAKAVGAKALVLTLDVPVRTTRPRSVSGANRRRAQALPSSQRPQAAGRVSATSSRRGCKNSLMCSCCACGATVAARRWQRRRCDQK